MRVLVAPQEFKGSLTAAAAAGAIARGIRNARPSWSIDRAPLSDGGPGFLGTLAPALGATYVRAPAHDALGRPIPNGYVLVDRRRAVAYVEAAVANGLTLIPPDERDPLRADTRGVGELLKAAAREQPRRIVVGVGGSATTDGGAGMAQELGAVFLDHDGRLLGPGGAELARLARIEWVRPEAFDGIEIVVATDVTNPLLGERGAARVFAPQKGATMAEVEVLEAALTRYARVLEDQLGVDVANLPGAGAAGGLAAGLVAFTGAGIVSGFDVIADAIDLTARVERADIVVTGEGRFDGQSLHGKTTGRVRALANERGKPCYVFAGQVEPGLEGLAMSLTSVGDSGDSGDMAQAASLLERLAEAWASGLGVAE